MFGFLSDGMRWQIGGKPVRRRFFIGLGHGFLFPGLSTYIVRQTNRAQRGSGLALFTGAFDFGILFGGLSSGYISQEVGYAGSFLVSSLLMLAALPIFVKLNR